MIRVVIAEDHSLVRAGIRALLERTGEFRFWAKPPMGMKRCS